MNTNDPPLNQLFTEARLHQPFGEPSSFGFETRLRAALAKSTPGFAEVFASLSWRFAAASRPKPGAGDDSVEHDEPAPRDIAVLRDELARLVERIARE